MHPFIRILLVCAASTSPGWTQPILTLQDAVAQALRTHPLLAGGAARIDVASGAVTQAGLKTNPRLVLQTENWRTHPSSTFDAGSSTDTFAYLARPLETGGKRERRVEFATAGLRRSEAERDLVRRQVAGRVQQAYWAAAGAMKVQELLAENARNFQQIVQYHEIRVKEGAVAEADLLKVRLEAERLAVGINSAALDAERARIQLFREMGQSEFPAVRLAELAIEPGADAVPDVAMALENRAEMKLARQALEQARANVRLQNANAKPDVEVIGGYKRTAGYNTVIGGVQWNLPWWNRNQGAIAAADAEIRVAESDVAATAAVVRAEVSAAATEVRMRRDQLLRLFGASGGEGLRGKAAESSRIAQAAYREGGGDLLRLLDAERVRIELQVLYFRTLAEYRQSVAALEAALGVNP